MFYRFSRIGLVLNRRAHSFLAEQKEQSRAEQSGYRYREFNLTPCELVIVLSLAEPLKRADCLGRRSLHSKSEGEKRRKRQPFFKSRRNTTLKNERDGYFSNEITR